ncbi:MAG: exodeoxyribonuclease VII large subunit [Acidobacteriia bacterium]|nr:exodeoxyribonuclease VII large subunit [Terriglobia bacterium]
MTPKSDRRVFTVSEITGRIKGLLEAEFASVWVEGEISNFTRAASGHLYFTIKDDTAQLRCVCFRTHARGIRFRLEDGLKIVARGSLSIYERRGEYQLYVEVMEPVGIGALQLAFEQLKAKLQAEGLFETARKKPLPTYPQTIGVVTSPTGAAIQDILRILKRRNESINVLIYPAKVQGEGAAQEIVEGIRYFNREQEVDVLIVGRGGGSIEDLWAFNEEPVARAIAASIIPVISAVGHEIDFTIADFAADLRAPTPSAAAEIVASAKDEISKHVERLFDRMENSLTLLLNRSRRTLLELTGSRGFSLAHDRLKEFRQFFDELAFKLSLGMHDIVRERRARLQLLHNRVAFFDLKKLIRMAVLRLDQLEKEAASGFRTSLSTARNSLMVLGGKLESLSPLKVLERGYAIVKTEGGVILNDAKGISVGTTLFIQLWQGYLKARVTGPSAHSHTDAGDQQGALKFEE